MSLTGAPQGQHNWWTKGLGGSRRTLRNWTGGWTTAKSVTQEGRKVKPIPPPTPSRFTDRKTSRTNLTDSKPAKDFFLSFFLFLLPPLNSFFLSVFSFFYSFFPPSFTFLFFLPAFFYLFFILIFVKIPSYLSSDLFLFLPPSFLSFLFYSFFLPSLLPFFFFFLLFPQVRQ